MSVTTQGMIGRAIMAADPAERRAAENVATLLMYGSRDLTDWRSVVVIDGGTDGIMSVPVHRWDGDVPQATKDDITARGWRVIDGRGFTAAGRPRAGRDENGMVQA